MNCVHSYRISPRNFPLSIYAVWLSKIIVTNCIFQKLAEHQHRTCHCRLASFIHATAPGNIACTQIKLSFGLCKVKRKNSCCEPLKLELTKDAFLRTDRKMGHYIIIEQKRIHRVIRFARKPYINSNP